MTARSGSCPSVVPSPAVKLGSPGSPVPWGSFIPRALRTIRSKARQPSVMFWKFLRAWWYWAATRPAAWQGCGPVSLQIQHLSDGSTRAWQAPVGTSSPRPIMSLSPGRQGRPLQGPAAALSRAVRRGVGVTSPTTWQGRNSTIKSGIASTDERGGLPRNRSG